MAWRALVRGRQPHTFVILPAVYRTLDPHFGLDLRLDHDPQLPHDFRTLVQAHVGGRGVCHPGLELRLEPVDN